MLGADGARTYLLVTLSPSDPRGSGGYPGVYGLLHVDGTQALALGPRADVRDPQSEAGARPADAKKAWGWAGIDRIFWDTTYTPDFPTAAGFMKGIWEAGGGKPVDGVIAGDPALMASLLQVVGPVTLRRGPKRSRPTTFSRSSAPTSTRRRPRNNRTRGRSASAHRSGTRCSTVRGQCRRWRPRRPAPLTTGTCRCGARGRTNRLRWERSA